MLFSDQLREARWWQRLSLRSYSARCERLVSHGNALVERQCENAMQCSEDNKAETLARVVAVVCAVQISNADK